MSKGMVRKGKGNMKVLLCCASGMSTSMLMRKMENYATENGIEDFSVDACSVNDRMTQAADADIVLMGPQVGYMEKTIVKKIGADKPHAIIPMQDYGRQNCEAIFKLIDDTLGK